ncbi:unnamed protein product, partial [Urochloa humidicola]
SGDAHQAALSSAELAEEMQPAAEVARRRAGYSAPPCSACARGGRLAELVQEEERRGLIWKKRSFLRGLEVELAMVDRAPSSLAREVGGGRDAARARERARAQRSSRSPSFAREVQLSYAG